MWSCLLQNALGQTRKIKELSNSTYTSRFVRLNCVRHANLNTKSIWVDMRSKKGDFFAGGVPNFILGFPPKRNILKISRRYVRIYQDISLKGKWIKIRLSPLNKFESSPVLRKFYCQTCFDIKVPLSFKFSISRTHFIELEWSWVDLTCAQNRLEIE